MRKYFVTAFVMASVLVLATSGLALEKTVRSLPDASRPGDWNAGATCSVVYYNICTGWGFGFSGWVAGDIVGTCFDSCCDPGESASLASSWWFLFSGSPPGYGFTGSVDVFAGDAAHCKTGAPLASTAWLPASGWNFFSWGGLAVPSRFIICGTFTDTGLPNPAVTATDHPNPGPTGPAACGTCYSSTRVGNSYVYASANTTSPCPPNKSPLSSAAFLPCDAVEFLMDAQLNCAVSVEESSWGTIKGLYR